MVPAPKDTDQVKAEYQRDDLRHQMQKLKDGFPVCCIGGKYRRMYFNDHQCDRDREHGVAKKRDPFDLKACFFFHLC